MRPKNAKKQEEGRGYLSKRRRTITGDIPLVPPFFSLRVSRASTKRAGDRCNCGRKGGGGGGGDDLCRTTAPLHSLRSQSGGKVGAAEFFSGVKGGESSLSRESTYVRPLTAAAAECWVRKSRKVFSSPHFLSHFSAAKWR